MSENTASYTGMTKKTGRPSDYNDAIADLICTRIANGESLRAICEDEGMPHAGTVCRWLAKEENASFREQYARARDAQADVLADEIVFIADNPQIGEKKIIKPTGEEVTIGDMIEHRRLQVEARKWAASKLKPQKYGDKIDVHHSGGVETSVQYTAEIPRRNRKPR
jgi:hypothetical protein